MMKIIFGTSISIFLVMMSFFVSCDKQKKSSSTANNLQNTELLSVFDMSADQQIAEYIRHIFQDKNGHLWFGTNNYGVAHYDGEKISYYSNDQGFGGGQITGITADIDQNIWFATEQGLVKYSWAITDSGEKEFTNFVAQEALDGKRVWSIFSDSKGVIWVGTNDGVIRYDGTKFEPFELPYVEEEGNGGSITNRTVWSTTEDKKGNIWFGTNGQGAFRYDGKTFIQYTERDGLTDNSVDVILEDSQGNFWFGTRHGGISRYDGNTFVNYTERDSIRNNEVCIVYEDQAGNIWFSSEGHGVYRYNGKSFTNFNKNQGLGVRAVQTIYEDKKGRLWVGGGGGLYRLDLSDDQDDRQSFVHITKNGPWK